MLHTDPGELDSSKLTFVLPVSGEWDVWRVRRNLLPSLDTFFRHADLAELTVIGTPAEFGTLDFRADVSPSFARRIRVVSETELAGEGRAFRDARGWHKQQVLKLLAGRRVATRLYCTLDADMYLVRPCGLSDWMPGGRCLYNPTRLDVHPRWWRRAARRLACPLRLAVDDGFGVTPSLLYTSIARELVAYLEAERGGVTKAIRAGATEYTLYWLYVTQHFQGGELYDAGGGPFYGRCLWKKRQLAGGGIEGLLDAQFPPGVRHWFSLIQSTTGIVDEAVVEEIRARILDREVPGVRGGQAA